MVFSEVYIWPVWPAPTSQYKNKDLNVFISLFLQMKIFLRKKLVRQQQSFSTAKFFWFWVRRRIYEISNKIVMTKIMVKVFSFKNVVWSLWDMLPLWEIFLRKTSPATTKFFNCEILLVLSPAEYLQNIPQNCCDENNGKGTQQQKC